MHLNLMRIDQVQRYVHAQSQLVHFHGGRQAKSFHHIDGGQLQHDDGILDANASAWSAAKRNIRVGMSVGAVCRQKVVRIKGGRIVLEVGRRPMHCHNAQDELDARGDNVVTYKYRHKESRVTQKLPQFFLTQF